MTLEEIRRALQNKNLTVVAAEAGVSYPQLVRLASGSNTDPRYFLVKKIEAYLMKRP